MAPPATDRSRRFIRLAIALAVLCALLLMYNLGAEAFVLSNKSSASDSTIMAGAEARILGPENAAKSVIFVHGFVGAGNNFNELPERLAEKGWRIHVLRLPGHGTNPTDLRGVTADDLLAAIRECVDEEQSKRQFVALVGHSMGGALSTITASEGGVDALVLGAPYFGVTHRWWYGLRPETWSRLLNPVVRWTYKGKLFLQVNKPEAKDHIVSYDWIPAEAIANLQQIGERVRQEDLLNKVTCPVLWMHSPNDVAASFAAAERAFQSMAADDKESIRVEKSNHHIFWDYDAEEVMNKTVEFLEARAPENGPQV